MAAETGFMIDGKLYEMPSLDSLNMDEAQVLYDYSGLTIEDFVPAEDAVQSENGDYELDDEQQEKMRNPGFMRALLHVAYQRGNPRMSAAKVKTLVGSVNVLDLFEQLATSQPEGDDALPPEPTTTPDDPSPSGSVVSSASSGDDSRKSSDGQVVPLTPITTTASDTSSTVSPQAESAV